MPTIHILTQYVWPDAAPTAIYSEDLAARLQSAGFDVRLVGGTGDYRALKRDKPSIPIVYLDHFHGRRGSLVQTFVEYTSVKRAFQKYVEEFVWRGDIAIVTSAPPNSVQLAPRIKRRGAQSIYWLYDYYPELIRGIREYPAAARRALSAWWDRHLLQWDRVVKIGANLGGPNDNAIVLRDWPTLTFDMIEPFEPGTVLYSGNLGYGHDIGLFVQACRELHEGGYRLTIRADGRGVRLLPDWLKVQPLHSDPEKMKADLLRHEVHLIAADPRITRAVFPSKIWNSIASGRRLICTGFAGEMVQELEESKRAPFDSHLDHWVKFIVEFASSAQRIRSSRVRAEGVARPRSPVPTTTVAPA